MKTINNHFNYVLSFSDGTVKVGVTSRPKERLKEICRSVRHRSNFVEGMFVATSNKASAFKTEANICRLLSYGASNASREWFDDERTDFGWITQATGMFWHLNNTGNYSPIKVSA